MCGECEERETFNVMINVRPCIVTRQRDSVSCESRKICLWEEKLSCVGHLWFVKKINVLN